MKLKNYLKFFLLFGIITETLFTPHVLAQQISINRIDQMPNTPSPYEMRDWKQVAIGYDNFIFNF
ncbi:MAG: hypothetical protein Q7S39_11125, partial [Ignavibacteria bacterium]|nr:hypothetical protein [Ignavibacteria bacterium]